MRGTTHLGLNPYVTTFKDSDIRSEIFAVEANRRLIEDRLAALVQRAAGLLDLACPQFGINIWGVFPARRKWGGSSVCGEYVTFNIPFPEGCQLPVGAVTLRLAVRIAYASGYDRKTCLIILNHFRDILEQEYS